MSFFDRPWWELPLFVIDFEGSSTSGIVEYGVVEIRGSKIVNCTTKLCRPRHPISWHEIRQHQLKLQVLAKAISFDHEKDCWIAWRNRGLFVAHHAPVEKNFLKQYWPYPPAVPNFLQQGNAMQWGPWIDTLRIFQKCFPQLDSYKLIDLIRIFQLEKELELLSEKYCPNHRRSPHCALYDALATNLLLQYLGKLQGFANMTLGWLNQLSQPNNINDQHEFSW